MRSQPEAAMSHYTAGAYMRKFPTLVFLQFPRGRYPEERFTEAVCTEKMEYFRKDLKALKGEIEA
ncbi:hydroperoxide isomerase ALOXE3-like, partial [Clarias magur]